MKNNMKKKLYAYICHIQDCADDPNYERMEVIFDDSIDAIHCWGNSQPVIDYLSQYDDDENELTEEEPYLARNGTDSRYEDENGIYTLLYNSSLGGVFSLYREATETEKDWYYNKRPDGISRD